MSSNPYVTGVRLAQRWKQVPGVFYTTPLPGAGECRYTITKPNSSKYATLPQLAKRFAKTRRAIEGIITRLHIEFILHEIPGTVEQTRYYEIAKVEEGVRRLEAIKDVSEYDMTEWAFTADALDILGYRNKASLNKLANSGQLNPERARAAGGRIINLYRRSELAGCKRV